MVLWIWGIPKFWRVHVKAIYINHGLSGSTTYLMTDFVLQHSHQVVIWTVLEHPEWLRAHRLQKQPISSSGHLLEITVWGWNMPPWVSIHWLQFLSLGPYGSSINLLCKVPSDIWIKWQYPSEFVCFVLLDILNVFNYLLLLLLNSLTNIISFFFPGCIQDDLYAS